MAYRSPSIQESNGNSASSNAFRHSQVYEDRSIQHIPAGGYQDNSNTGPRGNIQRESSIREGSDGHHSAEPAYTSTSNNVNRTAPRGSVGDNVSGHDAFGNQRGVSSSVHSSGGSGVGYGNSSSVNGGVSRVGQIGVHDSSPGVYRGVSSGGQSGEHDSAPRRPGVVSRGGQSGSQGGSPDEHRGGSSGRHTEDQDSGPRRSGAVSRGGQSGIQGGSTDGHGVSLTRGQSGDHAGSSRGSTGLGGVHSGRQNGGQSGGFGGYSSASTAGSFSGGFSSRSGTGFSSRSSANHQGLGGVCSSGGFGGSSGGGQRGCSSAAFSSGGGDGLLQAGEKETMQNLNSRLASYMNKVHDLEDSNGELENKIKNWYETHKAQKVDYSKYYHEIEDLKDKIFAATLANNNLTVQNDNSRLAVDDFRVKYESERCIYQGVESDTSGLRKVLDDLTLDKSSIESQIENLREDLAYQKKNHEDDMKGLHGNSGDVTVQMDAPPGVNILKILNDTRAQYEDLAEENRRKAEEEYKHKVSELKNEISHSSEQIESVKSEVTELRRSVQSLEIELQAQIAMKHSLENALVDTEDQYCDQLAHIQDKVTSLEDQLTHLRYDLETQSREHKLLLDIRSKLENEINMYRKLIEGDVNHGDVSSTQGWSDSSSVSGSHHDDLSSRRDGRQDSSSVSGSQHGDLSLRRDGRPDSSSVSGSQHADLSTRRDGRPDSSSVPDSNNRRVVTTITEERLNGRIVSKKMDKLEQHI